MATYCRHGDGLAVLTETKIMVFVRDGMIVSAETNLSENEREAIEERLAEHPPRLGRITTQQVQASLRVFFDEEEDTDDCTLGSEDTSTSDDLDDDYEEDW